MDAIFIAKVYELARFAMLLGEVPVAALVVSNNTIIGTGINLKERCQQPSYHAEMMALESAAHKLGSWRLTNAVMYSTLEPCPMCAGAMLQARIKRLVFSAYDFRWGAAGTQCNLVQDTRFNHQIELLYYPLKKVETLMKNFFKVRRTLR